MKKTQKKVSLQVQKVSKVWRQDQEKQAPFFLLKLKGWPVQWWNDGEELLRVQAETEAKVDDTSL